MELVSSSSKKRVETTISSAWGGVVLASLLMAGCGGGEAGSDHSGPPGSDATPGAPANPVTQPLTEMPASSYDTFRREAFVRLNEARLAAGVGALKQNAQLDAAAQAHATYLVRNYVTGHYEEVGKPFFTGVRPRERIERHGYAGADQGEAITSLYTSTSGKFHVDMLLNTVYHLGGLLIVSANEVGIGTDITTSPAYYASTSISLGTTDLRIRPLTPTWTWPAPGAQDMPTTFMPASETPNPLPDFGPRPAVVGAPAMLCSSHSDHLPLQITSLRVQDMLNGSHVASIVLHSPNATFSAGPDVQARPDSNLAALQLEHCVFVIPRAPWTPGRTFSIQVTGTQAGISIDRRWSFTTTRQ